MIRVGVLGAAGRMGAAVCRAVDADAQCSLVAGVDLHAVGNGIESAGASSSGLVIAENLDALLEEGVEVAVDFTNARAAVENGLYCAEGGIHLVCGTTGIGEADTARMVDAFSPADRPNLVMAANFAITAVLMMRFAEIAAQHLDAVEIIEMHHNEKRDAPSGTALETARRIAAARVAAGRGDVSPDPTREVNLEGARGGEAPAGVRIHSIRLPGLVAHQEVIFGAESQALTIRQDSFDRTSFMPGVLLAVKAVAERPGVTIGLEALLGL